MCRSFCSFGRIKAAVACWLGLAVAAGAQAADGAASDLQKGLAALAAASPKETGEVLRRVRLDQVVRMDAKTTVKGVYLDYSNYQGKDARPFDKVIEPALNELLKLPKDGKLDVDITPIDLMEQPHVVLQQRANTRNFDDVFLATSTFDGEGVLQVEGAVAQEFAAKLAEEAKAAFAGLKALRPAANGSSNDARPFSLARVGVVEWPLSRKKIQAWLADCVVSDNGGKKTQADPRLQYVRVDRIAVKYMSRRDENAAKDRLQIDFEMKVSALKEQVNPKMGDAPLDQVLTSEVKKRWNELVAARWSEAPAAAKDMNRVLAPVEDLSFLEFRDKLQKAVAADPTLDGTLVWKLARYNAAGELEINGVCSGAGLRDRSAKAIEAILRPTRLAEFGVNAGNLSIVNTRAILREMGRSAAENLDDVRIERLLFDENDKLVLQASGPVEAKAKIIEDFDSLLEDRGILKQIAELRAKSDGGSRQAPGADAPATDKGPNKPAKEDGPQQPGLKEIGKVSKGPAYPVRFVLVGVVDAPEANKSEPAAGSQKEVQFKAIPSLVAGLRKHFAKRVDERRCRGVLARRGAFDFDNGNRYHLYLVIDRKEQEAELRKFIDEFAREPEYAEYLGKVGPLVTFQVVSLDRMVVKLREVMPVDKEFDGYRVESGFHDAEGNLVLSLTGVGTPKSLSAMEKGDPAGAVRKGIKNMLDEDPIWRLRSRANERSQLILRYANPGGPVAVNPDIGYLSAIFAARNTTGADSGLARESVRTALLHNPSSSTLWFLSALFHLQEGREDLARRDVYRVMQLERDYLRDGPSRDARIARLQILEPVQGASRWSTQKLLDKVFLDYLDNKPPISMKSDR